METLSEITEGTEPGQPGTMGAGCCQAGGKENAAVEWNGVWTGGRTISPMLFSAKTSWKRLNKGGIEQKVTDESWG